MGVVDSESKTTLSNALYPKFPPFPEQGYVQNLFALSALFDAFLDNRL
jgi:hypothetical protein